MLRTIRLVLGSTALIAGATLVGIGMPARRATAIPVLPCDATVGPAVANDAAALASADSIAATCTPIRIVRSATPTFTATVATNTPGPTVAPTDTPVPPSATATSPGGGAGGAGIQPPNTGSGANSASGLDAMTLAGGAMLLAAGAGSLAIGARRRP